MTLLELKAMKSVLKRLQLEYERISPSCQNCDNYSSSKKNCSKFDAEPPPEWVSGAVPCDAWELDPIPF